VERRATKAERTLPIGVEEAARGVSAYPGAPRSAVPQWAPRLVAIAVLIVLVAIVALLIAWAA
jgi:hypothetical protein